MSKLLCLIGILLCLIGIIIFILIIKYVFSLEKFNNQKISIDDTPSIREWNNNTLVYLCRMNLSNHPDKFSFIKFCDRMIRKKDYDKFLSLIVDNSEDYENKLMKNEKFTFAPFKRDEWFKIINKKATGKTLGIHKMKLEDCEKIANNIHDALSFNFEEKTNKCEIKNSKKLIDSNGNTVYIKKESIQFTISFWINIKLISDDDRNIFVIKNLKKTNLVSPSIDLIKKSTSIEFSISTESNNEKIKIQTGYIPYKKWIHITFTLQGKLIKAFINSRLILTKILSAYPLKLDDSSILEINKTKNIKQGKYKNLLVGKIRIIPLAVPLHFIKNILIEEDPMNGIKYKNCIKKNSKYDNEISHLKCSKFLFRGIDDQQSENNINGRDIQLVSKIHFNKKNNVNRKPSFRIYNGSIIFLSGIIESVSQPGKILILPKVARPDKILYFNSGSQNNHVRLLIHPDGYVEIGNKSKLNGGIKLSLDNVRYPLNSGAPIKYEKPNLAYFIKISKPGNHIFALSDIKIFDGDNKDISKGKKIVVSSKKATFSPYQLFDGKGAQKKNNRWKYNNNSSWVSNQQEDNYVLIDLKGGHKISKVILYNTDKFNSSVAGAKISLLDIFKKDIIYKFWDKNDFKTSEKLTKTIDNEECENWYVKNIQENDKGFAPPSAIISKFKKPNNKNGIIFKKKNSINGYKLIDKKNNSMKIKKGNGNDSIKFNCNPGYIKSFKRTKDWKSIKDVECSDGKKSKDIFGEDGLPKSPFSVYPNGQVGKKLGKKKWINEDNCLKSTIKEKKKEEKVCHEKISKNNLNKGNKSCAGKIYLSENECKKVADKLKKKFTVENNPQHPIGCKQSPWNGDIYYSNVGGIVNNWSMDYNFYCKKDCSCHEKISKNNSNKDNKSCAGKRYLSEDECKNVANKLKKKFTVENNPQHPIGCKESPWNGDIYYSNVGGKVNNWSMDYNFYCKKNCPSAKNQDEFRCISYEKIKEKDPNKVNNDDTFCGEDCWVINKDRKKFDYISWNYNDYSKLGISDHNYCRQSPNESTWNTNQKGGKLWCYKKNKMYKKGYCGHYDVIPRNVNQKIYEPVKEFTFELTKSKIDSKFINYNNNNTFRGASWIKSGNLVFLSGFCRLNPKKNLDYIPEGVCIGMIPPNITPKSTKFFNCNFDNGVAKVRITDKGLIEFITGNLNSIGYKSDWISLDGINYTIEDKLNFDLGKNFKTLSNKNDSLKNNILIDIPTYYSEKKIEKTISPLVKDMSVSFFINAEENGNQVIFDKGISNEGALMVDPDGNIVYFYGKSGSMSHQKIIGMKIEFNKWIHVIIIRDLKKRKIKFYKDGKLVNSVFAEYELAEKTNQKLKIGEGWVNSFKGQIFDFKMYNKIITGLEIRKLYISSKGGKNINYGSPKITNHKNGLITLSGVVISKSEQVSKIADISEEFRPNKVLFFYTNQDDNQAMISITPDGEILIIDADLNLPISLDGISYYTNKSEQYKYE